MNIRLHVQKSIYSGLPARIIVQGDTPGVQFFDDSEFIPFADLGYNGEVGYYRLSAHPGAVNECESTNPETIHLLSQVASDDATMYVWQDGDGYLHHLGELWQVADLYAALGAALRGQVQPDTIDEFAPAWGRNYSIAQAVREALEYGYGDDEVMLADSIRAAARRGMIRGAVLVDGRWSIPPLTLRGWLVRSQAEKRGRPRKEEEKE